MAASSFHFLQLEGSDEVRTLGCVVAVALVGIGMNGKEP